MTPKPLTPEEPDDSLGSLVPSFVPSFRGPTVTIEQAERGRVTGWSVECSNEDHGVMPVLAPSKAAALGAAGRHIETEHHGAGRVRVWRPRSSRKGRAAA